MAEEEMDIEWIEENEETASARPTRASHIRSCCVEGCKSKGYRLLVDGERVQYFGFPLFDVELCKRWAATIRLDPSVPYQKAFVCSKHFMASEYKARVHEESKRTLRRSAIPSLEPVVGLTPPAYRLVQRRAQEADEEEYEEEGEDDDDDDVQEIVQGSEAGSEVEFLEEVNTGAQGDDNYQVYVINDRPEPQEPPPPAIIEEKKRLPLVVMDTLKGGPPYPWRKLGVADWINERTPFHEEHLQKVRDAITEESIQASKLEKECEERIQLLSLILIKKSEGRLTLKEFVQATVE